VTDQLKTQETAMDGALVDSSETSNDVEILSAKESWSEYRLADGTILRLRPVMIGVSRVAADTAGGEPVYNMKSTLVTDIIPARG
jgi:hypothetical protein